MITYNRLKELFLILIILFSSSLVFSGTKIAKTQAKKGVSLILYTHALTETDLNHKEHILKLAYKLNPEDEKISFLLGKTLIINNNNKLGQNILHELSENSELKGRIFKFLGDNYYYKKDFKSANFYYKKLTEVDEEDNYLYNYRLGEINGKEGLKNFEESNKYYLRAYNLRKYKDDEDILYYIADNFYNLKQYNNTLKYLKMYPYTNGNNQKAFKLLIRAYYRLKNKDELNSNIKKYLKIWPQNKWIRRVIKMAAKLSED